MMWMMTMNLPWKQMETTGSCAWQFIMTKATVRMEASIAPVQQTTPVEEWAPAWWNGAKTQKMFQKMFRWKWHVARNRFKLCPGVSDMGALPADASFWGLTFQVFPVWKARYSWRVSSVRSRSILFQALPNQEVKPNNEWSGSAWNWPQGWLAAAEWSWNSTQFTPPECKHNSGGPGSIGK